MEGEGWLELLLSKEGNGWGGEGAENEQERETLEDFARFIFHNLQLIYSLLLETVKKPEEYVYCNIRYILYIILSLSFNVSFWSLL